MFYRPVTGVKEQLLVLLVLISRKWVFLRFILYSRQLCLKSLQGILLCCLLQVFAIIGIREKSVLVVVIKVMGKKSLEVALAERKKEVTETLRKIWYSKAYHRSQNEEPFFFEARSTNHFDCGRRKENCRKHWVSQSMDVVEEAPKFKQNLIGREFKRNFIRRHQEILCWRWVWKV